MTVADMGPPGQSCPGCDMSFEHESGCPYEHMSISRAAKRYGAGERITVNLTARAVRALESATKLTGDSKTDAVNRALQVYALLEQVTANGGSIYIREAAESELQRVEWV